MSERLLPPVVRLTPTALEAFSWCPRRYLLRHVLGVPDSDAGSSSDQGLLLHGLLRFVHTNGTCHDEQFVAEVLAGHADDEAVRVMLERHRSRCPREFEDQAHEVSRARYFHRRPLMFLATARLDAVWVHDGLFDIRDYKTGAGATRDLRDDVRAQVQAWVWAPRAAQRGLRLRLRYEFLAPEIDEDPEPWELDDDDLAALDDTMCRHVEAIRRSDFAGVAEPQTCTPCPFRSVCRDSAAPGVPVWPALSIAAD